MIDYEEKKGKLKAFFKDRKYTPMKIEEIAHHLQVPLNEVEILDSIINELVDEYYISKSKKGTIIFLENENQYVCTFSSTDKGFGFASTDDLEEDVFIPASKTNGAINDDLVLVLVHKKREVGKKYEGEIIKIVKESSKMIVGTYEDNKTYGFVIPDNKHFDDIFIKKINKNGAVTGSKVLVRLTKRKDDIKSAEGEITKIIGHINDPDIDILSIVYDYEIPTDFPEEVMEEVKNIPEEVIDLDKVNKLDLRETQMITIDGEDAKDLDDAISITKKENHFILGVHIADVTNYVKENSPLDLEARKRGTSCYLVDRVIPMLPHKLSNGICSLNAGVERLALSCIMKIDLKGQIIDADIKETLINIDKRLSYTIVNDILTNENSDYKEEYKDFIEMFSTMEELRNILLKKRIDRGAIEFDFPECKIVLNKKGYPVDIVTRQRNIATSIIEEFMLICNETIAERFYFLEIPFVYRSHEKPDEEKILRLKTFLENFGYFIKGKEIHPKSIQSLLDSIDENEETIINRVVLRSMMQAKYTSTNDGHFGLAAKYYCHFTSPIRRYPDLTIHRIIKKSINNKLNEKEINKINSYINDICINSSLTERRAENAERDTNKLKMCEYMENKINMTFDGIISSITSWGIYVELPNTIEGMVSVNSLSDDKYVFVKEKFEMKGIYKSYKLGDRVQVIVDKVDTKNRTIDFIFPCDYR